MLTLRKYNSTYTLDKSRNVCINFIYIQDESLWFVVSHLAELPSIAVNLVLLVGVDKDRAACHNIECVSKIKHILSVIHCTICGAVCFQFTHFSCDDCENIYTLSYYHHQIGSMNYHQLFRVRSWNNGVRCMSFYILIAVVCKTTPNKYRIACHCGVNCRVYLAN